MMALSALSFVLGLGLLMFTVILGSLILAIVIYSAARDLKRYCSVKGDASNGATGRAI